MPRRSVKKLSPYSIHHISYISILALLDKTQKQKMNSVHTRYITEAMEVLCSYLIQHRIDRETQVFNQYNAESKRVLSPYSIQHRANRCTQSLFVTAHHRQGYSVLTRYSIEVIELLCPYSI